MTEYPAATQAWVVFEGGIELYEFPQQERTVEPVRTQQSRYQRIVRALGRIFGREQRQNQLEQSLQN